MGRTHNAAAYAGDDDLTANTTSITLNFNEISGGAAWAATEGRILYLAVSIDKSGGTLNDPDGWTSVRKYSATDVSQGVWVKRAKGGEKSVTVTFTNATRFLGAYAEERDDVTIAGMNSVTANSGTSTVDHIASGSVDPGGNAIGTAVVTVDSCSVWGGPTGQPTWSDSYTRAAGQNDTGTPGSNNGFPGWSVASKSVSASTSVDPTWTASFDQAVIVLTTFPLATTVVAPGAGQVAGGGVPTAVGVITTPATVNAPSGGQVVGGPPAAPQVSATVSPSTGGALASGTTPVATGAASPAPSAAGQAMGGSAEPSAGASLSPSGAGALQGALPATYAAGVSLGPEPGGQLAGAAPAGVAAGAALAASSAGQLGGAEGAALTAGASVDAAPGGQLAAGPPSDATGGGSVALDAPSGGQIAAGAPAAPQAGVLVMPAPAGALLSGVVAGVTVAPILAAEPAGQMLGAPPAVVVAAVAGLVVAGPGGQLGATTTVAVLAEARPLIAPGGLFQAAPAPAVLSIVPAAGRVVVVARAHPPAVAAQVSLPGVTAVAAPPTIRATIPEE